MDLDFKQLVYLVTIARNGSFSRAAQALNMSQPALSNSITQLERKVGGRVLARGRSGASLTETGKMLARHAELLEIQMAGAAGRGPRCEKAGLSDGSIRGCVCPVFAGGKEIPCILGKARFIKGIEADKDKMRG